MMIETRLTEFRSLRQAKHEINAAKGSVCPCCGQYVKVYRRKITSAMAYGLIVLYKQRKQQWTHIETFFKNEDVPASIRGDFPKLRFWDLIEKRRGDTDDGNPNNGYYRLTEYGVAFVQGKELAAKYVTIQNNQLLNVGDELVDIKHCLDERFNYKELMV